MKVELLSYTPNADKLVAAAAKLCYAKSDIDTLMDKLTPDKVESFLDMLAEIGHESPIEHASFTFGIEGVSRALLAQITRHRIASFSVQSQRYVDKSGFEYVLPPEIAAIPEAKAEFVAAMEEDAARYERLRNILIPERKKRFIAKGMSEAAAQKAAEKQRQKEEAAAQKAAEKEEKAKQKRTNRAVKNVARSAAGTIGRELGNNIGKTIGGSFGKKLGGNIGASLGRGILNTWIKVTQVASSENQDLSNLLGHGHN